MKQKPKPKQIPHHFKLDASRSHKKGQMYRSSGLYRVADESLYVYHCGKCDTTIELKEPMHVDQLNLQVALKYSCI
jgi:hypothetical protein